MRLAVWIICIFFVMNSLLVAADKAVILNLSGAIGPATQDYIERGISDAVKEKAAAVIIELNTPGGLDTAMRGINKAILSSPIPVITYVTPAGARAASAGVFIMYASHIAAMSPGTNIGAASPVKLGSPTSTEQPSATKEISTEDKKTMNDAAAYIRSLAELRGRNADWAERAVREAASISAIEAKKLNVIDAIANTYQELFNKINQRATRINGVEKNFDSANLALEKKLPDWRYQFLSFLTNPNMIYLLMLIAVYGIFFELSNPGLILPGVAGAIALLLLLYALQLAPLNYIGLALALLGIIFMIVEVLIGSFGIVGIGGVVAFIIGSIMLFDVNDPLYQVNLSFVILMSIITLIFFFVVLNLTLKSQRKKVVSGQEGLIGQEGNVTSGGERPMVSILGESWHALSDEPLNVGQKIKVIKVRGLTLIVKSVEKNQ